MNQVNKDIIGCRWKLSSYTVTALRHDVFTASSVSVSWLQHVSKYTCLRISNSRSVFVHLCFSVA